MVSVIAGKSFKNMGEWKSRKIEKGNKGSQTSGKSKGIITSPLQRTMCRRTRSWKHPRYAEVMNSLGGRGKVKKAG